MKKIIAALFVAAAAAAGAFAWESNVGIGFAVPINSYEPDTRGSSKETQVSYDAQFMYLGHTDGGFTLRASVDLGGTKVDTQGGFNAKEHIGIGYSFVRAEKLLLALTAGIGFQECIFFDDYNSKETLVILGGDLTSIIRFTSSAGIFLNANLGYGFGYVSSTVGGKTYSTNLKGGVSFTPSAGIAFTF